MAVAADRNPWLDGDPDNTDQFVWDDHSKTGDAENIKKYQRGNAVGHQREGQNVLFMDNHVYFEKQPYCGIDEDNIYTYRDLSLPPIQMGREPVCGEDGYDITQPKLAKDSLLVNECGYTIEPPRPPDEYP